MFVNPSDANSALDVLELGTQNATKEQLLGCIEEAIILLKGQDFPAYSDISSAVGAYVQLRDQLSEERKSWEMHEREVKDEMERISMWLRDKGDELGVDSFNTPHGTAYRNIKHSYRIEDWDTYAKWILETDNLQCLEKRPAKLAVKEIHDETGDIPPGLYQQVEVEFNVRRPSKKGS